MRQLVDAPVTALVPVVAAVDGRPDEGLADVVGGKPVDDGVVEAFGVGARRRELGREVGKSGADEHDGKAAQERDRPDEDGKVPPAQRLQLVEEEGEADGDTIKVASVAAAK